MARRAVWRGKVTHLSRYALSDQQVARGRRVFEKKESRDLFYRVASELIDLARRGATRVTLAEALAVLLQTWNHAHYRFTKFDEAHFKKIERLLGNHRSEVDRLRSATIEQLHDSKKDRVVSLFHAFEIVLGPVGAAKTLHLLAPEFFPL